MTISAIHSSKVYCIKRSLCVASIISSLQFVLSKAMARTDARLHRDVTCRVVSCHCFLLLKRPKQQVLPTETGFRCHPGRSRAGNADLLVCALVTPFRERETCSNNIPKQKDNPCFISPLKSSLKKDFSKKTLQHFSYG